MKYIAHKEQEREQTIKEHLCGTAQLAGEFAEKFGKGEWGYCCGKMHDIGKYSQEFQEKIKKNTNKMIDHSTAGAKICKELGGYYQILSYCIAGHHAGLPDYGNTGIASSLCGRYNKKIYDYQAYKDEIEIPKLQTDPIPFRGDKNNDFALAIFIRMIYSCLVDADFLDTEFFMKNGKTEREFGEPLEVLWKRLEKHILKWLENDDTDTINGRRTEILKNCIKEGEDEKGIFRLTVPTGGGKTIASLAFALKHAVKHGMDRIIYVIPYTSIIEQNAQIFRDILGEQNVLENHCNVDYSNSEEFKPMQLASENWDKPVIVTTNVQFFESLFSNKSSKCRKIHNIANSVIILDEAQMLSLDYLKPCTAMLEELVDNYKTSIVLCTATQPALDEIWSVKKQITELCPRVEEQFRFLKRVEYQNIGNISKKKLAEKLKEETNALCIVNTKKCAQELYRMLEGEGVYHLSTSMYPNHRKSILKKIRERLAEKRKCVVIATSLVEAGVDLDFKHVYRQIAGIDSMIQAAGRCNREGKNKTSDSNVYLFEFDDAGIIRSQSLQIDTAKSILSDYEEIADLDCITDYFSRLYHHRGETLDKKNIMNEFKRIKCNFETVAKNFKLIEQDTRTIFINIESEAENLLQEIKSKGISKERMRRAGQYCIQVFGNESGKNSFFNHLYGAGMIRPVSGEMKDFYELVSLEQYSESCGLEMTIDDEMALFF